MASMIDNFTDAQSLQSNQISSTVLDSPYSYDYATGSYIDKRNYYNQQWIPTHAMDYGYGPPSEARDQQIKSRVSEENPDSTTLINANNSGSAFSPSVVDVATKMQRQQPQGKCSVHCHHKWTLINCAFCLSNFRLSKLWLSSCNATSLSNVSNVLNANIQSNTSLQQFGLLQQ